MDINKLPAAYLERMKELLGDEYGDFLSSYDHEAYKGLRFNTTKVRPETIEKLKAEWSLKPVRWCKDGYYYEGEVRPGLSPYHDAGVFYIQEPSAMITAEMAGINKNDIVLDLCAAPGGKSTQAAAKCGILFANEPMADRARILSSNIERMGFDNCVVTSAYPEELANAFVSYFDKIIIDAPCSGEGMMRKDETAIAEWSTDNVYKCIERQRNILSSAVSMLKSGGYIIYSTCTFEKGEDEEQIEEFLSQHDDFELINMHRIMPHKEKGEGHFCAVLKKKNNGSVEAVADDGTGKTLSADKKAMTKIMNSACAMMKKKSIHVLRCGVEKGELKTARDGKSYYTPSHAEALAKRYDSDTDPMVNIISPDICKKYIAGEAMDIKGLGAGDIDISKAKDGFVTVYYDGYALGNAKLVKGVLKNHYPKGLRRA